MNTQERSMKIIADANIPFVAECFSSIGDVTVVAGRDITPGVVVDADVLLVRSITPVSAELLAGSRVRFVATATIRFDHVDVDFLRRSNIGFTSAPGSNANSAAEYVVAALLEIAQRRNVELAGKSIGIIGAGNVGSKVAAKCAALGMNVRLNDPPLKRQTGDQRYLPLDELFTCDFITFHTPLTLEGQDKTYHLADEKFFKSLGPGCVFINASRGAVVDSEALKTAIGSEQLGGVVLDVWEDEPRIDAELLQMVDLGTPHIAGYSLDGKIAGMMMIYEAVCRNFSLQRKFVAADFLPDPAVPELRVDPDIASEQEAVSSAAKRVYCIKRDDTGLREMLNVQPKEMGAYFDSLRKNYPVRREFQNTTVILNNGNESLTAKLTGIGFQTRIVSNG